MESISEVWFNQKEYYSKKSLAQIIGIIGDGKLRDETSTCNQFRDWLSVIESIDLSRFINDCLNDKFDNSGFALQDIINQIGKRLEFNVEYGLYHGKRNAIGFDGIWKNKEGYSIIVEVKTTDAYRINLNDIANYRKRLADENKIELENSSIIIVVGREDTGDLEAQIRGSKHAWDIRLISTESLIQLLKAKENFNDLKTINQINELLKPKEFTRVDSLIQIITSTAEDLTEFEQEKEIVEEKKEFIEKTKKIQTSKPANFHEDCIEKIRNHLKLSLIKRTRVTYTDKDNNTGLICMVSKQYDPAKYQQYWFAFHPNQAEFLTAFHSAFVAFGCGTSDKILLVPFAVLETQLHYLNITNRGITFYYHIHIHERDGKLFLILHKKVNDKEWNITNYLI